MATSTLRHFLVFLTCALASFPHLANAIEGRSNSHREAQQKEPDGLAFQEDLGGEQVVSASAQQQKWFHQKLDHFSPTDGRTFPVRYFESLEFWREPNGPIFLLVCGEYVCGGVGSDYREVLAKEFGAALVALEHRYYGESHPFEEMRTDNLRYLSSKQALVDLAAFREFYQADINLRFNRSSSAGDNPWIVIGVSYPGALSAWFRLKFPHLTRGSLASSAVVQAVLDFPEFDEQVSISAGPECAAALREVTAIVDEELAKNPGAIKAMFGAEELRKDGDFRYLCADAAVFAFQYGSPDALCVPLVAAKREGEGRVLSAYVDFIRTFFFGTVGGHAADYDQGRLLNTSSKSDAAVLHRSRLFPNRAVFWEYSLRSTKSHVLLGFMQECFRAGRGP
eukprot:TRINITY_DN6219_c0_g1_i1.p1 TRINITY_DN6219_c0_g1~~TRINITY_DN6219_c0_g1_i1.p1  ORF type:complete len:395 (+),score=48.02 TRINITY_DN6219_c0_g1_i1:41-1225(+)